MKIKLVAKRSGQSSLSSCEREETKNEEMLFLGQCHTNIAVKEQRKQSVSLPARVVAPEACHFDSPLLLAKLLGSLSCQQENSEISRGDFNLPPLCTYFIRGYPPKNMPLSFSIGEVTLDSKPI